MKYKNIIWSLLVVIAMSGSAGNLLQNASFEQGDKGPENWLRYRLLPNQVACNQAAAHSGKRGIAVLSTSDSKGAGWIYEKMIQVKPGEKYCLSGWIKSEAWGGNAISIAWFGVRDGRPNWKSTDSTKFIDGKRDWTQVKITVTVPENISFAKIKVGRKWKTKGVTYFDDISLEKLSGSKSAVAGSQPLEILWEKAADAENISVKKTVSRKNISTDQCQEIRPDAGTLKKNGKTLEISNTALIGVGWIGPSMKVLPGQIYGLQAEVELKKAYHVALGVALFDDAGHLLQIRKGKALCGTQKSQPETLLFRTTPKTDTIRLLLTQSRSSGISRFSQLALLDYSTK